MGSNDSETAARVGRLREELDRRNLDLVLLDDSEALEYFAGYETYISHYRACLFPKSGDPVYVLRALDTAPLRERTWIRDVVGYPDWTSGPETVADAIKARGWDRARIGIDLTSHGLTVRTFESLKRSLPEATFVDIDGLPWLMRKVKSPFEIDKLRRAASIADSSMQAVIDAAVVGISEREACRIAVDNNFRLGADGGDYGVITAGRGWDFLHGHLHNEPMKEGDVLHVELIPQVDGYSARLMRCISIGEPSSEMRRISEALIGIQDRQFEAMHPGALSKDVDRIVRQGVLDAGLRDGYDNITGYTLGFYSKNMIRASDFTWVFQPTSEWLLEAGMVFHMYTSAAGLAISETVLVTDTGAERLTKIPRKLYQSR